MEEEDLYLMRVTFDSAERILHVDSRLNHDFLYTCYQEIVESLIHILNDQKVPLLGKINPISILSYLINEHVYSTSGSPLEDVNKMENNEVYIKRLSSIVLDKYFTIEHLKYHEDAMQDRYFPPLTSLSLYLNYVLHSLIQFQKNDPEQTLMIDILHKGFRMCDCIIQLLFSGFETEAFSTWRTLHETECIARILFQYRKPVIDAYLRHITYGLAFRDILGSKEEQDEVFVEIKEKMKSLGLKSKDMKRFIECGWLYAIPGIENKEDFRLNFRNGTENMAGLSEYNSRYEMSSEIAHSSPLLIYSNRQFFFYFSIVNVYASFLRLEEIFKEIYTSSMPEKDRNAYLLLRNTYLPQLKIILEIETHRLDDLSQNHPA